MTQIFGDFWDELPVSQEGLTLVFSPTSAPLKQRWRNTGLSADFMADYFATFFPGDVVGSTKTNLKTEVKSTVSFIANELLENAMKFNDETSSYPISLRLQLHSNQLIFFAINSINPQAVSKFQALIKELTTSNLDDLYVRRLEENAQDSSKSQLGLLTMMNDYLAKLGWKFETIQNNPDLIIVNTMVQLVV